MTTIAFKDGILAADRRATIGNLNQSSTTKIHRQGGILIAASGVLSECQAFRSWVKSGLQETDPITEDSTGIIFISPIHAVIWAGAGPQYVTGEYMAFGSGREIALGAMAAGLSAEDAVKLASKHDIYTGNGVDTLKF